MPLLDQLIFSRFKASGFSLVEVLVAVLILSVGLLGLAALQVTALRNNHGALLWTEANLLASGLADRMRANPAGVEQLAYSNPTSFNPAPCDLNPCNPAQMAGWDLSEWRSELAQLPMGEGVVCLDSTPNDGTGPDSGSNACDVSGKIYAIKIWWNDFPIQASWWNQDSGTPAPSPGISRRLYYMSFQP
jgi:type IV pilus assembly protein PilV